MGRFHDQLSEKAAKWLKSHKQSLKFPRCSRVYVDLVALTSSGEVPDVIGFSYDASILIESKVSRADFLKDKKKAFRCVPEKGVGEFRLYICPDGLIKESELPEKWGLLYAPEKGKIVLVKAPVRQVANLKCERTILLSVLRRGGV